MPATAYYGAVSEGGREAGGGGRQGGRGPRLPGSGDQSAFKQF